MRKRASDAQGILLCFFLNLLLNFEWGVLALFLWSAHAWLGVPKVFIWIALFAWGVQALAFALLVRWGHSGRNRTVPPQENKNPYSASTSDYLNDENRGQ